MIDREHDLSITKQAEALRISRGSVYYLPRPVPEAELPETLRGRPGIGVFGWGVAGAAAGTVIGAMVSCALGLVLLMASKFVGVRFSQEF